MSVCSALRVGLLLLLLSLSLPLLAAPPSGPPVLNVPGDPSELRDACRDDPFLSRWAGGWPIMGGLQSALLPDDQLPILDRPHLPWGKPLAGGPVRIGYFGWANSHGEGDMAQVALRLDCKLYVVEIPPNNYESSGLSHGLATDPDTGWLARKALKTLDRDLDVIVLAQGAQELPPDVVERIKAKVAAGCGLYVGVPTGDSPEFVPREASGPRNAGPRGLAAKCLQPEIVNSFPTNVLPQMEDARVVYDTGAPKAEWKPVATYADLPVWFSGSLGKGRIVAANYEAWGFFFNSTVGTPGGRAGCIRYEEYWAQTVAHLLRWLCGRDPGVVMELSVPSPSLAGADIPLGVTVRGTGPREQRLNLEVSVRDWEFNTVAEKRTAITVPGARETSVQVQLPSLPAGTKFVASVIARNAKGESVDWACAVLETTSELPLKISTDQEIYKLGDTVEIRAETGDSGAGLETRVRVWDATGRLLQEHSATVPGDGRLVDYYELGDVRTPRFRAEVTLSKQGQALVVAEREFFSPINGWDDWQSSLWSAWWTSPWQYEFGNRVLRDWTGQNSVDVAHGSEPFIEARLGMRNHRLNDGAVSTAHLYTGPEGYENQVHSVTKSAIEWVRRYGTSCWNLQDERGWGGGPPPDFGPKVLERFRAWLQEAYAGDIAQLNGDWGTEYADFGEVKPVLETELPNRPADLIGWVATRSFIRNECLRIDQATADLINGANLPTKQYFGIDAFIYSHHTPYSGVDFGAMLTGPFNTHFPYTTERQTEYEMARGLAPQDSPFPSQAGEKSDAKWEYFSVPWRQALAGGAGGVLGVSRFIGWTFVHEFGYLYPQALWYRDSERPLREGLGKVLLGAKRETDPVVFMYSYPSTVVNWAAGRWIEPNNEHLLTRPSVYSVQALQNMCADCGITARWLTDRQIAAGALGDAKLLIIADYFGMALSEATCAAIRKFVADGGTVLADMAPAVYDERGKLRSQGGLDELFGVTRDRLELGTRATDWLVNGDVARDPRVPLPSGGWYIAEFWEKSLKVAGGKALGQHIFGTDAPAFIINDTGKGHTMLLNFLITQYNRQPDEWSLGMMRAVLRFAGVSAPVRVVDSLRRAPWGYQVHRYREGDNYYVGVYRLSDTPSVNEDTVTVELPQGGHVYLAGGVLDASGGIMQRTTYLGKTDRPRVTLKGAGSALLAVLPYQAQGLSMSAPGSARLGERVRVPLRLTTTGRSGRHVVRVTATDPGGSDSFLYSANVTLTGGTGDYYLPLALNDAVGAWTLTAREAVSGQEARATIRVSRP